MTRSKSHQSSILIESRVKPAEVTDHSPNINDGTTPTSQQQNIDDADDDDASDRREYMNFLNGILFLDQDALTKEPDEEEDDEDFKPGNIEDGGEASSDEDEDGDGEEDEDEEDDEEDKNGIDNIELADLLLGSLEAMAGGMPEPPTTPKGQHLSRIRHSFTPDTDSINSESETESQSLAPGHSESENEADADSSRVPENAHASIADPAKGKAAPTSIIASLAAQFLSGERRDSGDLLVEGMPVGALRSLVARQYSMAAQLLLQTLLQASLWDSVTSTDCSNRLFELSNVRLKALKHAALMRVVVESLSRVQGSASDNKATAAGLVKSKSDIAAEPEPDIDADDIDVKDRRLTRTRARALQDQSTQSSSVLDLPLFADVAGVLAQVDRARAAVMAKVSANVMDAGRSAVERNLSIAEEKADAKTASECRALLLSELQAQGSALLRTAGDMRNWQCLVPTVAFPLPTADMRRIDPDSFVGRHAFVPAEDELLLRAVVQQGEGSWQRTCEEYLVSKTPDQVHFRFEQLVATGAAGAGQASPRKFREYARLSKAYARRDQRWQPWEDAALLRGFATHGERWPLVQVNYLPRRSRADIISRWAVLQQRGQAARKRLPEVDGNIEDLPPSVVQCLQDLHSGEVAGGTESSHYNELRRQVSAEASAFNPIEEDDDGGDSSHSQPAVSAFTLSDPSRGQPRLGHAPLAVPSALRSLSPDWASETHRTLTVSSLAVTSSTGMRPPLPLSSTRDNSRPVVDSRSSLHLSRPLGVASQPPRVLPTPIFSSQAKAPASPADKAQAQQLQQQLDAAMQALRQMQEQMARQSEALEQQVRHNAQMQQALDERHKQYMDDVERSKLTQAQQPAIEPEPAVRKRRRIAPQTMDSAAAAARASSAPKAFADAQRLAPHVVARTHSVPAVTQPQASNGVDDVASSDSGSAGVQSKRRRATAGWASQKLPVDGSSTESEASSRGQDGNTGAGGKDVSGVAVEAAGLFSAVMFAAKRKN